MLKHPRENCFGQSINHTSAHETLRLEFIEFIEFIGCVKIKIVIFYQAGGLMNECAIDLSVFNSHYGRDVDKPN